jgi:hypothetical protein
LLGPARDASIAVVAADFMETNRVLSRVLAERARGLGVFDHPTAKGDGREDLVRDFLRERIGTNFGVSKGEVVDSLGKPTPEFDAVIYDQSTASVLNVAGGRSIVRVESVAIVVEVKSVLDASTCADEEQRVRDGIGRLLRFYQPAPLLQLVLGNSAPAWRPAANAMFINGLSSLDTFQSTPAIVNAYFAFDGPSEEAGIRFLSRPLLDVLCVLGKYTITRPDPGSSTKKDADPPITVWGRGHDALGAFLQMIDDCLRRWREAQAFVQSAGRYYKPGG